MWKLTSGQLLEHRGWDDEFVIYNSLSGDTHLLGAAAMQILLLLKDGAGADAALLQTLRASCADGEPILEDELGVLLDELKSLSLVERTGC